MFGAGESFSIEMIIVMTPHIRIIMYVILQLVITMHSIPETCACVLHNMSLIKNKRELGL